MSDDFFKLIYVGHLICDSIIALTILIFALFNARKISEIMNYLDKSLKDNTEKALDKFKETL